MGLFSETVPREQYDDMKRARDTWQAECAYLRAELSGLMKDMIAVKRHELGLPPSGMAVSDPTSILGPKTMSAIEMVADGFADVRAQQMNWAVVQTKHGLAHGRDADDLDAELAAQIRQGDEV